MANLYEITGNYLILQEMLYEDEVPEQALLDTIEAVDGEFDYKIEGYCKIIKNIESDIEAVDKEAKRLTEKKKVLENRVERLKKTMFDAMKLVGKTKAGGNVLGASIQKNGGKLPIILDEMDYAELPEEYRNVKYTPNNETIREALDKGKDLKFARYGERGESLRIK